MGDKDLCAAVRAKVARALPPSSRRPDVIDDITQDALLAIQNQESKKKALGEEIQFPSAYANKVVRSKVADYFRRNDRDRNVAHALPPETDETLSPPGGSNGLDEARMRRVEDRISEFYPDNWQPRSVMEAYRRSGFSRIDTANVLGKSLGYVDGNLNRFMDLARAIGAVIAQGGGEGAGAAEWESVEHALISYRPLLGAVGFQSTVEEMQANADRARQRLHEGESRLRRSYIITECALGKLLQQCGRYPEASARLARIDELASPGDIAGIVGEEVGESVLSLRFRLDQGPFGTDRCARNLRAAIDSCRRTENKARFLWRQAIDAIAYGSSHAVPDLVMRYRDMTQGALIPSANADLIGAFQHWRLNRHDEAAEFAKRYRRQQLELFENRMEIPDPSIQGVLSGLVLCCYLQLLSPAHKSGAHDELQEFSFDLRQFQAGVGVTDWADGLREITSLFEVLVPNWRAARSARRRKQRLKRGSRRDFRDILAKFNQLVE